MLCPDTGAAAIGLFGFIEYGENHVASFSGSCSLSKVVVVVLLDPLRAMGAQRNSTGTQQSVPDPRSGLDI